MQSQDGPAALFELPPVTASAATDPATDKVTVKASFTHEGLRVLESGLEPRAQVIVEGLQLVRGGMSVKTRPASSTSCTSSSNG